MFFFILTFLFITTTIGVISAYTPCRYFIILHIFTCYLGVHMMILSCNPFLYENKEDCENYYFSTFNKMTNMIRYRNQNEH
jgi:hypothetical protein